MTQHYDVVIIGGGQAGLAMGYYLARRGMNFLILDAAQRSGDAWRKRWDSLTLFTPARHSALPGLAFPAEPQHMPRKDEVADYLESYARHFGMPIRYAERVIRVRKVSEWNGFTIETATNTYEVDQVVVATGPFQQPFVPAISATLGKHVVQLHSSEYREAAQLPAGGNVLVVGGGNSGVQIAAELARTRRTWLSVGEKLPRLPQHFLGRSIYDWLDTMGAMNITINSRLGRRASAHEMLIGATPAGIAREYGVEVVQRAQHAEGNRVFTTDGRAVEVAAVIWATGFRQDFQLIDGPVLDRANRPIHVRGVTPVSGLYFLGLPWQHTRGSALLGWVGRDAAYLAEHIGRN